MELGQRAGSAGARRYHAAAAPRGPAALAWRVHDAPVSRARDEAAAALAAVADDPSARVALREAFYASLGLLGPHPGTSELAFTRWECRRGVLNPLHRGGSAWWRAVNDQIVLDSEAAARLPGADPSSLGKGEAAWQRWIASRRDLDWYRAHNTSVVSAYIERRDMARLEPESEHALLNVVLYRVLYAQLMEEGRGAGGDHPLLDALGKIAGDPCFPAVDVVVHVDALYPDDYPMTASQHQALLGRGGSLGSLANRLFDDVVVLERCALAYHTAARVLDLPALLDFVTEEGPFYPDFDDLRRRV